MMGAENINRRRHIMAVRGINTVSYTHLAAGLTVVFCGKLSGKPGPKSAAWRMPWQKSGNDDVGGVNPRLFPAGPRTEHKGSRRRLRFTRPCRAWPCGFSVMWPQRRVRAVPCLHLSRAGGDARVRFAEMCIRDSATYVPPFLCDAHAVCRYTAEGPAEPDGA